MFAVLYASGVLLALNCSTYYHACMHSTQEILRVNVLGYVNPTKALLPAMIQRREGRVVFVSSQAGQVSLF